MGFERIQRVWEEEELPGWAQAVPADLQKGPVLDVDLGLAPFVFEPGPVPSSEELAGSAEVVIRNDRALKDALLQGKGEITEVLQAELDQLIEKVTQGDEICKKAHFPLLNPFDVEDVESFPNFDFTVDIKSDVVDRILSALIDSILGIVWRNVPVENTRLRLTLERYNQALLARMETLEHHLRDRALHLSNCRFSYYLEVTHLRNQIHLKQKMGDEFEPLEAYFFEPTEYLEEDLRSQLDDKIKSSLDVKERHLREAKRIIELLEDQLREAQREGFDLNKCDDLSEVLRMVSRRHGEVKTVEALADVTMKEMREWAAAWAQAEGWVPREAFEALRQEQAQRDANAEAIAKEMEELREALRTAYNELVEQREQIGRLEREVRDLNDQAILDKEAAAKAMEALERSKADTGHARPPSKRLDLDELEELRRKLLESQTRLDEERALALQAKTALAAAEARLAEAIEVATALRTELGQRAPQATKELCESLSDEDRIRLQEHADTLSLARDLRVQLSGGAASTDTRLWDHIDWLGDFARGAEGRQKEFEKYITELNAATEAALAAAEAARAEAKAHAEALEAAREALEAARRVDIPEDDRRDDTDAVAAEVQEDFRRAPLVGNRQAVGNGFEVEVQTNITAHGNSGFYLLEVPPTDAENAIKEELEDLNMCAFGNWDTTLEQIRQAQCPPRGSGNGICPRGCFLRLFMASRQRLRRHEELVATIMELKRGELRQVLEGVHFLMESKMPDDDATMRELIFGRGFTPLNVSGTVGTEFTALTKRWCKMVASIIEELLKSRLPIELGLHLDRRNFMLGGGAGGVPHVGDAGGAGGGIMARQRKNFSPSRQHQYRWLLGGDREVGSSVGRSQSPPADGSSVVDDHEQVERHFQCLTLLGKAIFQTQPDDTVMSNDFPAWLDGVPQSHASDLNGSQAQARCSSRETPQQHDRPESAQVLTDLQPSQRKLSPARFLVGESGPSEGANFVRPRSAGALFSQAVFGPITSEADTVIAEDTDAGVTRPIQEPAAEGRSLVGSRRPRSALVATVPPPGENAERAIERIRQRMCSGGGTGPLPTEEYERLEGQRSRHVGGRHAGALRRPEAKTLSATLGRERCGSAPRLRAMIRNSTGNLRHRSGGATTPTRARPSTAPRSKAALPVVGSTNVPPTNGALTGVSSGQWLPSRTLVH
jgi:hypothetical protein